MDFSATVCSLPSNDYVTETDQGSNRTDGELNRWRCRGLNSDRTVNSFVQN
jgi:hypothetical protein